MANKYQLDIFPEMYTNPLTKVKEKQGGQSQGLFSELLQPAPRSFLDSTVANIMGRGDPSAGVRQQLAGATPQGRIDILAPFAKTLQEQEYIETQRAKIKKQEQDQNVIFNAQAKAVGEKQPQEFIDFLENSPVSVAAKYMMEKPEKIKYGVMGNPETGWYVTEDGLPVGKKFKGETEVQREKEEKNKLLNSIQDGRNVRASVYKARKTLDDPRVKNLQKLFGGWSGLLKFLPNTAQRTLSNDMDTIRNMLGFSELRKMKDSGTSLGQVSNFENRALQTIIDKLDDFSTREDLLNALDEIEARTNRLEELSKLNPDATLGEIGQDADWENPSFRQYALSTGLVQKITPMHDLQTNKFKAYMVTDKNGDVYRFDPPYGLEKYQQN
jgi:hypothetical protein